MVEASLVFLLETMLPVLWEKLAVRMTRVRIMSVDLLRLNSSGLRGRAGSMKF